MIRKEPLSSLGGWMLSWLEQAASTIGAPEKKHNRGEMELWRLEEGDGI